MKKDILLGISGDSHRLFVGSAFGCDYCCSYCYLRDMDVEGVKYRFSFDEIITELNKMEFIRGRTGTIISIGCFTECLAVENRKTTLQLINYFLKQGNYVQLSTKKRISDTDAKLIEKNIQFKNQINIFVSIPTISKSMEFEPGLDSVFERQNNLNLKEKYSFNTIIYIKPVIPGITISDKEKYIELIKKNNVPVIVGEMLKPSTGREDEEVLIGSKWMKKIECDEQRRLINILKDYTRVYEHSIDIIMEARKK